jgi:hypothetical protein
MAKRTKRETNSERQAKLRENLHVVSDSAGQNAEQFEVEEPTEEDHEIAREIFKDMNEPDAIAGPNVTVGEFEDQTEEVDGEKVPNSIVKPKFKDKYAANAAAIGDTRKQVKRSNWDWLSQQLAAFCLNDKGKIDIGAFTDVLEANGIDHSKWTNRNKGWEGRFRMTGRVALQKVVANSGSLAWPNGEPTVAPPEWCEQYKTKA